MVKHRERIAFLFSKVYHFSPFILPFLHLCSNILLVNIGFNEFPSLRIDQLDATIDIYFFSNTTVDAILLCKNSDSIIRYKVLKKRKSYQSINEVGYSRGQCGYRNKEFNITIQKFSG